MKFVNKIILVGLCAIGMVYPAAAQQKEINFISLTTEDGLSSNNINAILKDRYGMVWLGTEDGLNKFDGTHLTIYRHNPVDSGSLLSNEILSLHEDKAGNLWVGTSGGSLSLYDRKKNRFIHFRAGKGPNSIKNNVIRGVCSDYTGKIWIAHYDGVNVLDPKTGIISLPPIAKNNLNPTSFKSCNTVFEDQGHRMWIGTTQGAFRYDPANHSISHFSHQPGDAASLGNNNVNAITQDNRGNVWIATNNGLSKWDRNTDRFINFTHDDKQPSSLSSAGVSTVAVDGDNLWIGTTEGLNIMNMLTDKIDKYQLDHRNIHGLTAGRIKCIYIDKQGIYWLGTIRGGVDRYDKNLNLFNYVRSNYFDEKGLNASVVNAFEEAENGNVFVGTDSRGLSIFDPKTKLFQHVPIRSTGKNANDRLVVLSLKLGRNKQLKIGTFGQGLIYMDPDLKKYSQLLQGPGIEDLNSSDIYCITETRDGNTWVGTNGQGINVLDANRKVIRRYTPNPIQKNDVLLPINGYIREICEDKEGLVWIATHGGGMAVLQPSSGKFTIYNTMNSNLPNDKIQSIIEDSRGLIWAGTLGGGLVEFNKTTKKMTVYSEDDGLQNSTVYEIQEDNKGMLWVSTNKGISSIDTKTKAVSNYNHHNGLQHNNFARGASIRLSDGTLFFGGLDGINYFDPSLLIKNKNIPTVMITGLRISNQPVQAAEKGPIQDHISVAKEINLNYKQNFALDFVGVSYTAPEQNKYAYKLEGFDKDWNYVGNTTTASYTNLDPGRYVFRVKASNNDGVWNNEGASITVYVHPPFWRTTYAYIIYVLAAIGTLFYIRHRGIQKIKRKYAIQQEKAKLEQERKDAERTHELDMLKIKFLTNLSHEFRTPISLILGPVDTLITQQKHMPSAGKLEMIKRNGRRLLNLVNQLLDFRKLEEHELKIHSEEGELVTFIKEISDSFSDLAERKNIDFSFTTNAATFHTLFDHDKLERVLFNVLSNAFKFTPAGGTVRLELEKTEPISESSATWFNIKIADTGIGIPPDKKEKIFELFFQNATQASILNQGTGIGLSITKEFVKMQGGKISVDSEPDKGTTFTIQLPFILHEPQATNNAVAELSKYTHPIGVAEEAAFKGDLAMVEPAESLSVLLVEDNDDFRFYLKDNLRLQYKVIEAANGKEGWQKALTHHPQLIVSDINMPEMDGIEFSQKIKGDKRTSHIPIILLTAMTAEEDQLRGLKTGANDYISKPFNAELLNAKIRNLLVLNSSLKNTYSKQIKAIQPETEIQSEDEKFLQKVIRYLEENLSNPQLSVEDLSRHVGMSRSTLYLKVLELTGQKPVEYIREFKLEKAAMLLEKSGMNVNEVAYSVGFSTPNYFAKSFKLKFKLLPSEYMSKMRNGKSNGA